MAEPNELPERIQRDLEEALRDGGVDKLPQRPRPRRRQLRLRPPDPRPRNPGQLVLIGVGLFVVAYLAPVPFRAQLFLAAFICVGLALLTHFARPYGSGPRYWRGKYVNLPASSWQERLYRLIYRQG